MVETIKFTLNRKPTSLKVDKERNLLWVLRTDLDLTGTKTGAGRGCAVLVWFTLTVMLSSPVRRPSAVWRAKKLRRLKGWPKTENFTLYRKPLSHMMPYNVDFVRLG